VRLLKKAHLGQSPDQRRVDHVDLVLDRSRQGAVADAMKPRPVVGGRGTKDDVRAAVDRGPDRLGELDIKANQDGELADGWLDDPHRFVRREAPRVDLAGREMELALADDLAAGAKEVGRVVEPLALSGEVGSPEDQKVVPAGQVTHQIDVRSGPLVPPVKIE